MKNAVNYRVNIMPTPTYEGAFCICVEDVSFKDTLQNLVNILYTLRNATSKYYP
jgi:hypothetical protein